MKASEDQLKYFLITGMFALPFQPTGPAVIRSLTDRLTVDAIKNPIRFISVTLAAIAQALFGSGVKPQVKTISKKLVRTLMN
jgi:hypothetical protein